MDQLNSTVETLNFSSPGFLSRPSWDSARLVPAAMLFLCFSVGVPGNIAVIVLKPNWEHLSSMSQRLMLNLAVSDLLCLMTLPIWIYSFFYGWTFSLFSCKLLVYLMYCSIYGSLLSVTGLSVQRYVLVVHQQRCHQIQKRLLLVLLWLVACILSIPALMVQQRKTDQQWTDCRSHFSSDTQWLAALMTETLFGFVSFFVVAFSYIRLQKKINQTAFFNHPQTNRLVTCIIVILFVLWVPYHTINVLGITAICLKNEGLKKLYTNAWDIVAAVTFINSCLNPLLYAFTSCKICYVCSKKEQVHPMQTISQTEDNDTTSKS